jgi:hypothetical protein
MGLMVMCLVAGFPFLAHAQLTGSVGIGAQATNNVQSLDTIAPDQILMPAFQLNYDVHASGVSTISLTGSWTPSYYNLNPGLSFNETSIGATGVFYISNQDAISAEALQNEAEGGTKPSHSSHLMRMEANERSLFARSDQPIFFLSPDPILPSSGSSAQQSRNDSLVDLAVTALYMLSGELDSTDISSKGISKARVSELEDLRDSISDVISTIADLLDSEGYSASTAEAVVSELKEVRPPLIGLMPHTKPSNTDTTLLDAAIHALEQAKPETDFLPTAPSPSAPPTASPETKQLVHSLASIQTTIPGAEAVSASAPIMTLLASNTRLREFGYNDAVIHEDIDDSGATTMATTLTIPVAYTSHVGTESFNPSDSAYLDSLFGGNYGGNPNDNKMLTFGAAFEGITSTNFSLRGSYDFSYDKFAFDSVYSNTENRITLTPRLAAGKTTVFIGEGALGFKQYHNPLAVTQDIKSDTIEYDTTRGLKGRIIKITPIFKQRTITAQSNFSQLSYGLGVAELLGERWILGALADFNYNPTLRAYVTTAQLATKKVRAAAQVADDEYTYDLSRYSIFTTARIFADLDFGLDFSYEHRLYGAEVGPKGAVLFGDSTRVENGEFLNASLSKLIPFENHLIGVFNGLLLEAKLEWDNVISSAESSLYNYTLTDVTFTATLTF